MLCAYPKNRQLSRAISSTHPAPASTPHTRACVHQCKAQPLRLAVEHGLNQVRMQGSILRGWITDGRGLEETRRRRGLLASDLELQAWAPPSSGHAMSAYATTISTHTPCARSTDCESTNVRTHGGGIHTYRRGSSIGLSPHFVQKLIDAPVLGHSARSHTEQQTHHLHIRQSCTSC